MRKALPVLLSFAVMLAACAPASSGMPTAALPLPATATITPSADTPTPAPPTATPTAGPSPTATPDTRIDPRYWTSYPPIPLISARAREIYMQGLELGARPYSYSVVGDCQSVAEQFLGIYVTDRNPIGEDEPDLLETIGLFEESLSHQSVAVRNGLSAPSALDPLWADPNQCRPDESPVACEMRLYRPMLVFVNLGTNWQAGASADAYEGYLREVVEIIIANGGVPILSTKADNIEGDRSINLATARVAYAYDIPLMNFWAASDSLPGHGLEADGIYLTPAGWGLREYLALKTLDAVWRALMAQGE